MYRNTGVAVCNTAEALLYVLLSAVILTCCVFCSTLLYPALPYSTLLYPTLLYSTLRYSTLLYSTLLYSTLLYSTLLFLKPDASFRVFPALCFSLPATLGGWETVSIVSGASASNFIDLSSNEFLVRSYLTYLTFSAYA